LIGGIIHPRKKDLQKRRLDVQQGLPENPLFAGCSKRALPSSKRLPSARLLEAGLRAGRQMKVEPCEIPFCGSSRNPEECGVLDSTPQRRRTCQWAGETPQMAVFQQAARRYRKEDGIPWRK